MTLEKGNMEVVEEIARSRRRGVVKRLSKSGTKTLTKISFVRILDTSANSGNRNGGILPNKVKRALLVVGISHHICHDSV
jgi:hypothetical protein